jgi:hypothetical protein
MNQQDELIKLVKELKTEAKAKRDLERYGAAIKPAQKAIAMIDEFKASNTVNEEQSGALNYQLSDCFGIMGGIYRRWALSSDSTEERAKYFDESRNMYDNGYQYEPTGTPPNSYNLVNRLVGRIFSNPALLAPGNEDPQLLEDLTSAQNIVDAQLKTQRKDDVWALADEALLKLLLSTGNPDKVFDDFFLRSPDQYAFDSLLSTLRPLSQLSIAPKKNLLNAVSTLEKKS